VLERAALMCKTDKEKEESLGSTSKELARWSGASILVGAQERRNDQEEDVLIDSDEEFE
jgi:hypothetical protein